MDTLIFDLSGLIDGQLDCYQAIFLGYSDNGIRLAIYFYCNNDKRMLSFCDNEPNNKILEILKRYLKNNDNLINSPPYTEIFTLGFKYGDRELVELLYPKISDDADRHKCILEAIKFNQTDLVLKYEHPCLEQGYDFYIECKIVEAYRSKNQRIIEHILTVNNRNLDDPVLKMTRLLMMTSTASDTEKRQLNQEFIEIYNSIRMVSNGRVRWCALNLIVLAVEENNIELYIFLRKSIQTVYCMINSHLIENVNDTPHSAEIITSSLDLNDLDGLECCTNCAYGCGRKHLFKKLISINPQLINKVNIVSKQYIQTIDVDILKTILSNSSRSLKEIQRLIRKSLMFDRYDLFIYLSSVECAK